MYTTRTPFHSNLYLLPRNSHQSSGLLLSLRPIPTGIQLRINSDVPKVRTLPRSSIKTTKAAGLMEIVADHERIRRDERTPLALRRAAAIGLGERRHVVVGVETLAICVSRKEVRNERLG